MKIKFLFHKAKGDPKAVRLSTDDWCRRIRQETEASADEAKQFPEYLDIITGEGKWELNIEDDWTTEEKARVRALYKAVEKSYKASLDYERDIAVEAEEQKVESAKRGQLIVVGAEKGRALASMAANHLVKDIATAMKGKFIIDGVEMKMVKGAKPTEKDFSEIFGCLLSLKGAATDAADAAGFYLVDAIRLAKGSGFDGDALIEQVANAAGVEKFTAMAAQRHGEFWPPEKRMVGPDGKLLSMTAHAEIANYAGGVKEPRKLEAVIKKVAEGQVDEITTPEGKKIKTTPKPYSTKAIRALMQEASGKPTPPKIPKGGKGGAAGCPTANFIYIGANDAGEEVQWRHTDLSMMACEDEGITVIDLMTMTRLDAKGAPKYHLEELPAKYFLGAKAPEVKPVKEEKKATPKKEPKPEKKAEKEPEPTCQIPE